MREAELTRLRRKRYAIQRALTPIERALAPHQARLVKVAAVIRALDPVLDLPRPRPRRVRVFAKGELTRLARDMLRQAGRPLAMREMVRGALLVKGLRFPDRCIRPLAQRRLQAAFERFEARGLVMKVGRGHAPRRGLGEQQVTSVVPIITLDGACESRG